MLAPFNPTPRAAVEAALDMLDVKSGDVVADLGCGDGRLLVAAARRGATAVGVELDETHAARASSNVAAAGVADRATVVSDDGVGRRPFPASPFFRAPVRI